MRFSFMKRSAYRWSAILMVLAALSISMPAVAAGFDRQVDEAQGGSLIGAWMIDGIADLFQDLLEIFIAPSSGDDWGGVGGPPPDDPPPDTTLGGIGTFIDPNGHDRV